MFTASDPEPRFFVRLNSPSTGSSGHFRLNAATWEAALSNHIALGDQVPALHVTLGALLHARVGGAQGPIQRSTALLGGVVVLWGMGCYDQHLRGQSSKQMGLDHGFAVLE